MNQEELSTFTFSGEIRLAFDIDWPLAMILMGILIQNGGWKISSEEAVEEFISWELNKATHQNRILISLLCIRLLLVIGYIGLVIFTYFLPKSMPTVMLGVHFSIIIITALAAIAELFHMIDLVTRMKEGQKLYGRRKFKKEIRKGERRRYHKLLFFNCFHFPIGCAKVIFFSLACYFAVTGDLSSVISYFLAVEILNALSAFINNFTQKKDRVFTIPISSMMASFSFVLGLGCILFAPDVTIVSVPVPFVLFALGLIFTTLSKIGQAQRAGKIKGFKKSLFSQKSEATGDQQLLSKKAMIVSSTPEKERMDSCLRRNDGFGENSLSSGDVI